MKALNKAIKTILSMMCWAVFILMIFQFSTIESFGQPPLTIKVETNGNKVQLTSNNYNSCEWTSSSQDIIYVSPTSGKTTVGTAVSYSPNWIVITCRCSSGSTYLSQCIELTVQNLTLNINQGYSGISRGSSGSCQYGSF